MRRGLLVALCLAMFVLCFCATAVADSGPIVLPANDLNNLLALTGFPTPAQAPLQHDDGPPLASVPPAVCGPGSHPLDGEQGRVPMAAVMSPAAANGWTCNVTVLGHNPTPGGFRTWRYVDTNGHVCAFYDTSLYSPLNVVRLAAGPSQGVAVLDMSDPAHPVQTAMLTSLPMELPHESLNLNAKRGLLAAEMGNGTTLPGLMSIYDVSQDCRHPVLDATLLAARFGHESGFAPDGRTFYIGGGEGIAAIDVSDPEHPKNLWEGNVFAHGLNVSDDGNRLYDSDPINGNLVILDVSQIQARAPSPSVKEISRLTWKSVSIPQNTDPMTIDGHKYLLEFDEFAFRFSAVPPTGVPGAARIINIDDEAHPKVVSNIRLAVNEPEVRSQALSDPSAFPTQFFAYSAHYCAIPREVDPEIAACSFINSGLRIFNISDPLHPREVAYYVSPPRTSANYLVPADVAMSQPAFDPADREVWYTDASTGFYSLRLPASVWPDPLAPPSSAASSKCAKPAGRLRGSALGPLQLGEARASARKSLSVCLTGGRIRGAYVGGRVALLLTANRHYALHGVRAGARLASVSRRLRAGSVRHGTTTWYLSGSRRASGVLEVRRGRVVAIGLARADEFRRALGSIGS